MYFKVIYIYYGPHQRTPSEAPSQYYSDTIFCFGELYNCLQLPRKITKLINQIQISFNFVTNLYTLSTFESCLKIHSGSYITFKSKSSNLKRKQKTIETSNKIIFSFPLQVRNRVENVYLILQHLISFIIRGE